jgi:hypothetical protein
MMIRNGFTRLAALALLAFSMLFGLMGAGCVVTPQAESVSGVKVASVQVQTDPDGETVEQKNVKERIKRDNTPGSIKFLYVISPFTGDVIFQSTVKGKVTSSGKRLTPSDIAIANATDSSKYVVINGKTYVTAQNPQDDGTYGDSIPYLYWFDENGVYHQQYLGAAVITITDQPMRVKKTTQAVETAK